MLLWHRHPGWGIYLLSNIMGFQSRPMPLLVCHELYYECATLNNTDSKTCYVPGRYGIGRARDGRFMGACPHEYLEDSPVRTAHQLLEVSLHDKTIDTIGSSLIRLPIYCKEEGISKVNGLYPSYHIEAAASINGQAKLCQEVSARLQKMNQATRIAAR